MTEQWTIAANHLFIEINKPDLPQTNYLPPYGYPRKCKLIKDKSEDGDPQFVHDQQIEVNGETLITCKEFLFSTEQEAHDYLRQILRPMSQDINSTVARLIAILDYIRMPTMYTEQDETPISHDHTKVNK